MKGCVQWNPVYGREDLASSGDRTRIARSVGAPLIDGWIVDFSFYVLPNSISIISAR